MTLLLALSAAAPAAAQHVHDPVPPPQQQSRDEPVGMAAMFPPREASGTAWLPDFTPRALLSPALSIERRLERGPMRSWSAHYLAVLRRGELVRPEAQAFTGLLARKEV